MYQTNSDFEFHVHVTWGDSEQLPCRTNLTVFTHVTGRIPSLYHFKRRLQPELWRYPSGKSDILPKLGQPRVKSGHSVYHNSFSMIN